MNAELIPPVRQIDERPPTTWGRRLYLAMVAMIGLLATYPAYNHFRINRLESLRADITRAGGRAPRSRGGSRPASEIYWESLGGDLSRVVLHQVEFAQPARLERSAIARLSRCAELERLCLDGQTLDDDLCRQIFSLRQLRELRVAYCELQDNQLQGIEHMDELVSLDLRGTRISDASVERLSRLAGLGDLDIDYCDITPAGAERLSRALPHTQIRHRPWPTPEHRDASLRLFRLGAALEISEETQRGLTVRLSRHRWRGSPEELSLIGRLRGIELLELSAIDLEPKLLDAVAQLPNIESLSIHNCQLRSAELTRLHASRSIRRLVLDDVFIELPAANAIAQWRGIHSLALVHARLVPGSLAALASLPNLEGLAIVGLRFRSTRTDELAGATALKRLRVDHVPLGDSQVQELTRLPGLESLCLRGTAVSDASMDHLASLRALHHLDVSQTLVSSAGIARLAAALPECRVESRSQPESELDKWALLNVIGPSGP